MNKKDIFSAIIILSTSIISYYFSGIIWTLNFIVTIWFYIIIFYAFHLLWKTIRKQEIEDSIEFMKKFTFKISTLIVFLVSIIGSFSYLSNEIYPAEMPEHTVTNWEKTIVFQAMVHIWKESFYDKVAENLKSFKENWWVYFYEWVRPWSQESADKFNQALWADFNPDFYKNFSKLYWVTYQDNAEFLWLVNDKDFNIDLSIDEIVNLYDERISENQNKTTSQDPLDMNKEVEMVLSNVNDKELKLLVYINQAILNLLISSDSLQTTISENFWNKDLMDVILHERNTVLADAIMDSEYNDIYITYGLLHFKWILEILQENDSNWKITNTKYLYPIK